MERPGLSSGGSTYGGAMQSGSEGKQAGGGTAQRHNAMAALTYSIRTFLLSKSIEHALLSYRVLTRINAPFFYIIFTFKKLKCVLLIML
jgi:hypothetical protein